MRLPPSLGLLKTSLLDYPGKIASVIFFPGCNMRCPYCHNPGLALGKTEGLISRDGVLLHIQHRARLLGGVVLSGGEPLLYKGLGDFIQELRNVANLGIKVDTNGLLPGPLSRLLEKAAPDFIAMDIKSIGPVLPRFGISAKDAEKIKESISLIKNSGMDYHLRTTVHPDLIREEFVPEMADLIRGCKKYILNPFKPGNCLNTEYNSHQATTDSYLKKLQQLFLARGIPCELPSI